MGLICSLTGHKWSEPETRTQRDERGDEVKITKVEYQECARCGEQKTITENTEVRAIKESSSDASQEQVEQSGASMGQGRTGSSNEYGKETPDTENDAEILDSEPEEEIDESNWAMPDDESDSFDRDDEDRDSGDSGLSQTIDEDETELIDTSIDEDPDYESQFSADVDEESQTSDSKPTLSEVDSGESFESPDPDLDDSSSEDVDDYSSVLVCPRCDFEGEGYGGSLREGDICPDCGKGYLDKRPAE